MPRNLYRRVETLFPIEDPGLKIALRDQILKIHLKDNVKARRMLPDGTYERVEPKKGEPKINSQQWLIEHRGIWHGEE
jgi:polyphosphate kinase